MANNKHENTNTSKSSTTKGSMKRLGDELPIMLAPAVVVLAVSTVKKISRARRLARDLTPEQIVTGMLRSFGGFIESIGASPQHSAAEPPAPLRTTVRVTDPRSGRGEIIDAEFIEEE